LRLEIGPNDLAKKQVLSVRRDTGVKAPMSLENIGKNVNTLLDAIQVDMFVKAKANYDERLKIVNKWDDLVPTLDAKCIAVIPWCEREACEDDIKGRSARA
jgi:prolyl-tRNA synthetase